MKQYNLVVCGGTFDHFHRGHKEFLRFAFSLGERMIVGITSNEYLKITNLIEPYEERRSSVESFLRQEGILNKADLMKINDVFGPTLERKLPIEAIIVTRDSQNGADTINKKREEIGLPLLPIKVQSLVFGEDGKTISSQRIRNGEINREGKVYINPSWLLDKLALTEDLRQELKHPLGGTLFKNGIIIDYQNMDARRVITVGDVATKTCNDINFEQAISVIDFHVKREKKFDNLSELGFLGKEKVVKIINPAGFLTPQLFLAVKDIFAAQIKERIIVEIDGEEDLAVLPFLLTAPLDFIILYGQPGEGVVKVTVSEENKERAHNLVSRFVRTRGY